MFRFVEYLNKQQKEKQLNNKQTLNQLYKEEEKKLSGSPRAAIYPISHQ
jgi:hypothetical protein